jgi:hypothetical protein
VAPFLPPEQGNFFALRKFSLSSLRPVPHRHQSVFFLKPLGRSFVPISGVFYRRFRGRGID